MIKAILFDFGGVYAESPFSIVNEIAVEMGVEPALLHKIVFGEYHNDGDHPWHRLERGEISLEKARELIIEEGKKHDLDTDIFVIFIRFADVDRSIRGPLVDKTLEWHKKGVKLAIITNHIKEASSWREQFPFDVNEVFEAIADSSELGVRKPNAGIYQHALDKLGVAADEALFLDDYPENIHAAEALGIHGFLVDGPIEDAIQWVDGKLA